MTAYVTNSSELWPPHLTTSQLPDGSGECLTATAVQNESCPAGGFGLIVETIANFDALLLSSYNISFFNDDVSRNLMSYPPFQDSTAWITTSIGQVLARSLGLFNQWANVVWKLSIADKNGRDLLKPLVQVVCNASLASNSTSSSSTLNFPYGSFVYYPLSNLPNNTQWTANESEHLSNTNLIPVQFAWVDLSANSPGPSLGASFRLSNADMVYANLTANPSANYTFNDAIYTCSIDARWTPVKPFMSPVSGNAVGSDFVSELQNSMNFEQIRIDPSWAQALNVPMSNSSLTTIESLINVLISVTTEYRLEGTQFLRLIEAALGLVVTNGLSRIGWDDKFAYIESKTSSLVTLTNNGTLFNIAPIPATLPDWLALDLSISHYGYSYSTSTVTVKIAIAVLLLHAVVAVIHAIVVCVPRHVWTSESWSSVGQLLALALNSRPNRENLPNSCAGVDLAQTWRQSVKIREVEDENLEMLVGHEPGGESTLSVYDKPKPGKVYGNAVSCEFDTIQEHESVASERPRLIPS
jgi:hypothetical protein